MGHCADSYFHRVRGVKKIQVYNNKGQPKIKGQLFADLVGKGWLVNSQLSVQQRTKSKPEELANQKKELVHLKRGRGNGGGEWRGRGGY